MFLLNLFTTIPSLKIFGVVDVLVSNFVSLINWKSIWIFKPGRAHMNSVAQLVLPGHRPKRHEATVYALQRAHQATAATAPRVERSVGHCRWTATGLPTDAHLFTPPRTPPPVWALSFRKRARETPHDTPFSRASTHSASSLCCV
jgi:hypothetical protein